MLWIVCCIVYLYLWDEQRHSEKPGTGQERSHLMVRKHRDFSCKPNPWCQPRSSRYSFSGFIVLDLFTYLFCLGSPVGRLLTEILLAKEDHRHVFSLRHFESSVPSVLHQIHEACHSTARQNSWVSLSSSKHRQTLLESQTLGSWPKKVVWILLWLSLVWLSNTLAFILHHILKRNVPS